tara:strand:+ start:326 stop:664 length:339 start_codon:yes stop_codon:yes gene_type:complete
MNQSEDRIQQDCCVWFRNTHLDKRGLLFSVPNGGYRNAREAKKMKDTGLFAGVSDLLLMYAGKTYCIEMKTPTGSQSKSQIYWEGLVKREGFSYYVCRSLEEFKAVIHSIIK